MMLVIIFLMKQQLILLERTFRIENMPRWIQPIMNPIGSVLDLISWVQMVMWK